ncbi:MAG: 8-oxoguanine deaminase [Phycisphaerae bacterium]|nr:8-oxoguanine deaminase [Phycisphaerae bacterium]
MTLLIHDTTVITLRGGGVLTLRRHSLEIDGTRVASLAPAGAFEPRVRAGEFSRIIDGRRRVVIPGLVNTHHHLYQSITRCLPEVQNRTLFGWLSGLYPRWRRLDHRAVRAAAAVSLAELALNGCTTTSDHFYMFPAGSDVRMEAVLEAAELIGMRVHLCRGSMTLGTSAGGLPPDDCVERDADVISDCQRCLDRFHDPRPHARVRIDLAPCSPFNVSAGLFAEMLQLARTHGALLHTHLAETVDEDAFCAQRYGCRPLEVLAERGWLGPNVYLAHCVRLRGDEIATLAASGTAVAHCPTSNMRLASGAAPLRDMLRAGVRVGLAVDGSSSNDCGNLLAEARQALLVARLGQSPGNAATRENARDDASRGVLFPVERAMFLATAGGGAVLNRPELGRLDAGAAADFAVYRTDDVALAGGVVHDPLAALVLGAPPRADQVFVAGREIVRNGRLTSVEEESLAEQLNAAAAALT